MWVLSTDPLKVALVDKDKSLKLPNSNGFMFIQQALTNIEFYDIMNEAYISWIAYKQ